VNGRRADESSTLVLLIHLYLSRHPTRSFDYHHLHCRFASSPSTDPHAVLTLHVVFLRRCATKTFASRPESDPPLTHWHLLFALRQRDRHSFTRCEFRQLTSMSNSALSAQPPFWSESKNHEDRSTMKRLETLLPRKYWKVDDGGAIHTVGANREHRRTAKADGSSS
jgi:hypothetical protein